MSSDTTSLNEQKQWDIANDAYNLFYIGLKICLPSSLFTRI